MNPAFVRVFIVMFENELESAARQDPYLRALEQRGVRMSQYHGVAHPSQPNYIAAITGLPYVADDNVHDLDTTSIVDLLEAKGVSWKAYLENLPEDDKAVAISADGLYYRKHNPFISVNNIRTNPQRLAKVVNADRLAEDVAASALPQYAWYTPNIQNDGHSPPGVAPGNRAAEVHYLSQWLQGFLPPLLADPRFLHGTLVVITFDESIPYADNQVYTTLLGEMVQADSVEAGTYDHYSLLRTVEENFGLGSLGRNDVTANWFRFLWGLDEPLFNPADHHQPPPAPPGGPSGRAG
jgi:phospholipase C